MLYQSHRLETQADSSGNLQGRIKPSDHLALESAVSTAKAARRSGQTLRSPNVPAKSSAYLGELVGARVIFLPTPFMQKRKHRACAGGGPSACAAS
jgi:hypothetical protein